MIEPAVLTQWVVYENPADFPGMFVAREWLIGVHQPWCRRQVSAVLPDYGADCSCGGLRPSEITPYVDPYLENVRRFIAAVAPGSVCLARSEADDPTIVETWT